MDQFFGLKLPILLDAQQTYDSLSRKLTKEMLKRQTFETKKTLSKLILQFKKLGKKVIKVKPIQTLQVERCYIQTSIVTPYVAGKPLLCSSQESQYHNQDFLDKKQQQKATCQSEGFPKINKTEQINYDQQNEREIQNSIVNLQIESAFSQVIHSQSPFSTFPDQPSPKKHIPKSSILKEMNKNGVIDTIQENKSQNIDEEVQQLKFSNEMLKQQINQLMTMFNIHSNQLQRSQFKISEQSFTIEELKEENIQLNAQRQLLENKVQKMEKKICKLNNKIESSKQQVQSFRVRTIGSETEKYLSNVYQNLTSDKNSNLYEMLCKTSFIDYL